jgi:predicted N-acetyltransferase YhbS
MQIRPAQMADIPASEALLLHAFPDVFRPVFGAMPQSKQVQVLAALRQTNQQPLAGHLVAVERDQVVGVLWWKTAGTDRRSYSATWRALASLSPTAKARLLVMGVVIFRPRYTPVPHEAYLRGLVVAPAYRRQGVGLALIQAAEAAARETGKTMVCALVAAQNHASRSMFQKLGYTETSNHKRMLRRLLFWRESTIVRIEKPL